MSRIDLNDAKGQLEALVAAAERGEEIVITRKDRPAVKLVSVASPRADRKAGSARGMIVIGDDFDTPMRLIHPSTD